MSTILVAGGSGGLGSYMVKELVASPKFSTVKVLARPESRAKAEEAAPKEVSVVAAAYDDHAGLVNALKGVDIVISVLNGVAVGDAQIALIKAAKEAGVQRFVPAEFGIDPSRQYQASFYADKIKVQQALQTSGLDYILYGTGSFTDLVIGAFFGIDVENNKATIVGDGESPISWSLREDIAKFVAETVGEESSKNKVVNFEGDVKSLNEVIKVLEKKKGSKFQVTYKTNQQALTEAKATGHPGLIAVAEIQVAFAEGAAKISNPTRPSFKPKTVEEWAKHHV